MGRKGNFTRFSLHTGTRRTVEFIIASEHAEKLESYLFSRVNGALVVGKALGDMKVYLGRSYEQESGSARTGSSKADLEKMDCSEFVSRYLQKVTGAEQVPSYTTSSMVNTYKGSNDLFEHVKDSDKSDFKDIRPGDIFLWRRDRGGGHTGVVVSYNRTTDQVAVMEAIASTGSSEEGPSKSLNGYCKDCIRNSMYSRTGRALQKHEGWKGYFRPKISIE